MNNNNNKLRHANPNVDSIPRNHTVTHLPSKPSPYTLQITPVSAGGTISQGRLICIRHLHKQALRPQISVVT
jgi:hypothetical protein